MKTNKERLKEALENVEKGNKELELLQNRTALVMTEVARLQGEARLLKRIEDEEKEEAEKNKKDKK